MALGGGVSEEIDSGAAIEVARNATRATFEGEPVLPSGMEIAAPVVVVPDEYDFGNVTGTLTASGLHEIAVRRTTERAGEVVIHFPRQEYAVIATG